MGTLSPLLERLHEALRLRGRSPYWLQRRLHNEGVLGSRRGSVSRYMRGEIIPPIEFLQAAARALNVFEPWLLSGYGSPDQHPGAEGDPEVKRVERMSEQTEEIADRWAEEDRNIDYRIADRCWWYRGLNEPTRHVVRELFQRCAGFTLEHRSCIVPWDRMQTSAGADLELARELGTVLNGPLAMLGLDALDPAVGLSDDQRNDYVLTLCAAVSRLLPLSGELTEEEEQEIGEKSRLRLESVKRYQEKELQRRTRRSQPTQRRRSDHPSGEE